HAIPYSPLHSLPTRRSSDLDSIVPKFQKFAKLRGDKEYYVRGTFTKKNLDFGEDVFHYYDDLGFDQISMEPVVTDPANDYALTRSEEHTSELQSRFDLVCRL